MLWGKDLQKIAALAWAQEVWSSNLHAPTISFLTLPSGEDSFFAVDIL